MADVDSFSTDSGFWQACWDIATQASKMTDFQDDMFSRVQLEIIKEVIKSNGCSFDEAIRVALHMEHVITSVDGAPTVGDKIDERLTLPRDWQAIRVDGASNRTVYWNRVTNAVRVAHPSEIGGRKGR
jgi:hypothetical protein